MGNTTLVLAVRHLPIKLKWMVLWKLSARGGVLNVIIWGATQKQKKGKERVIILVVHASRVEIFFCFRTFVMLEWWISERVTRFLQKVAFLYIWNIFKYNILMTYSFVIKYINYIAEICKNVVVCPRDSTLRYFN